MVYEVHYYETVDGHCPVYEFINSRSNKDQAKLFAWIEKLEEMGPTLPRPYADLLQDGIHELRCKLKGEQHRVLYFFVYQSRIVLTHAFMKTSSKVPDREIRKAQQMREDYIKRNPA
jgi:hypothetical protein